MTSRATTFLVLAVASALGGGGVHALEPDVPLAQRAVDTIGRHEGLPTDTVRAVARTADGVLWIGTELGLVRWDGASMTTYTRDDGLPSDAVEVLAADGDALWIGTPRGLARRERGVFSVVPEAAGVPHERVVSILVAGDGALWVATKQGVLVGRGTRFEPIEGVSGTCNDMIDHGDEIIVACRDAIHRVRDGRSTARIPLVAAPQVLARASDGTLWIGTDGAGVHRLAPGAERPDPVAAPEHDIRALFVDAHGTLWIGHAGAGVTRRHPDGSLDVVSVPGRDPPGGVFDFVELPDGSLVFGSINLGLVHVRAGRFRLFDGRSDTPDNALSVFEDRTGAAFIASATDPILRVVRGGAVTRLELPAPALTHLEEADGTHLVGTPAGLFRLADGALVPVPIEGVGLVGALARTHDGALWIAALHDGLARVVDGVVLWLKKADGAYLQASTLHVARDRTLWVGTFDGVCNIVARLEPPRCLGPSEGMPAGLVLGLHEDARGAMWAATYEHGLVRIAGGRARALGREHGLEQDSFYAVLEDDAGRFWLPGPRGITRVARAALEVALAGGTAPIPAQLLGAADGLPIDETTGGSMSAYRAASGRMWFATPRGAVMVDPSAPEPVVQSPRAVIDEVRIGNVPVPIADAEVDAGTRDLLVRYGGPTLVRADQVQFRHRLVGVDDDWVDAGTRRVAMYTDLPPGRHRFEVVALAPGAPTAGEVATLSFDFAPRFAETPWFVLMIVFAAAALVYTAHRWRLARHIRREAELGRQVDLRTRELAAAQRELEALNASLAERVEIAVASLRSAERMAAYGHTVAGVAHEVRQPLFALGTTAFTLGSRLKDNPELMKQVRLLERETKRMNRVMDELLDFAKPAGLEVAPTSIGAVVRDAVDAFRAAYDPDGKVPIEVRLDDADLAIEVRADAARLQQVVTNLIANAHKHATGMTRVVLTAGPDLPTGAADRGASWHIEVSDDGSGIAEADLARVFEPFFTTGGTGLGLALARRIVLEHGGAIDVRSGSDGTTFTVRLPREGPAHA